MFADLKQSSLLREGNTLQNTRFYKINPNPLGVRFIQLLYFSKISQSVCPWKNFKNSLMGSNQARAYLSEATLHYSWSYTQLLDYTENKLGRDKRSSLFCTTFKKVQSIESGREQLNIFEDSKTISSQSLNFRFLLVSQSYKALP